jgi:hypothetical protein
VNPVSQKGLLKYALNKPTAKESKEDDSDSDGDVDYSKFNTKKGDKMTKEQREKELAELKAAGQDVIDSSGAIRLPNRISKGLQIDARTGTAKSGNDRDCIMSPTSFL